MAELSLDAFKKMRDELTAKLSQQRTELRSKLSDIEKQLSELGSKPAPAGSGRRGRPPGSKNKKAKRGRPAKAKSVTKK